MKIAGAFIIVKPNLWTFVGSGTTFKCICPVLIDLEAVQRTRQVGRIASPICYTIQVISRTRTTIIGIKYEKFLAAVIGNDSASTTSTPEICT